MRMIDMKVDTHQNAAIPDSVVRMAEAIIAANGPADEPRLRRNIGADETQPLKPALENWLIHEIQIDNEDIAHTIFRHILALLEHDADDDYGGHPW